MLVPFEAFLGNLAFLRAEIAETCAKIGRNPESVSILPVTKNHPAAAAEYVARAGLSAVGENRVQEARDKKPASPTNLQWELIGHLQSNKARLAISTFDRIQSVDSVKLAGHLGRAAHELERQFAVLVQVNAGRDPAKFGCEIEETPAVIEEVLRQPALRLDGLMTIAPLSPDPSVARRTFETLRELRDTLAARFGQPFSELSMGMSGDLQAAILAGSTQVRVGTALFGQRN
jgi:PLP dependent protein